MDYYEEVANKGCRDPLRIVTNKNNINKKIGSIVWAEAAAQIVGSGWSGVGSFFFISSTV